MSEKLNIDSAVFKGKLITKGYLITIESTIQKGIIIATPEMADNPQEYANEALQSVGTVVYGSDNIGKQIAFRYDVLEDGGIKAGARNYSNRLLMDGRIVWEVNKSDTILGQVIGILEADGWHCWGRHVVLKQVVVPERTNDWGFITPETVAANKYEVVWPNRYYPVGTTVSVDKQFISTLQVDGQLLYYIPQEYILLKYND